MIISPAPARSETPESPTVWGLNPQQLHERFWAAQGVQVVRRGQKCRLAHQAQAFLLLQNDVLAILDLAAVADVFAAPKSDLVYLRIDVGRQDMVHERVVTDEGGQFVRFRALLRAAALAKSAGGADGVAGRGPALAVGGKFPRRLAFAPPHRGSARRSTVYCCGRLFDSLQCTELAAFVKALAAAWPTPQQSVTALRQHAPGLWMADNSAIDPQAHLVGPLWIGSGRVAGPNATLIGPAVLWDEPAITAHARTHPLDQTKMTRPTPLQNYCPGPGQFSSRPHANFRRDLCPFGPGPDAAVLPPHRPADFDRRRLARSFSSTAVKPWAAGNSPASNSAPCAATPSSFGLAARAKPVRWAAVLHRGRSAADAGGAAFASLAHSMNFRNFSTFWRARCRWSGHAPKPLPRKPIVPRLAGSGAERALGITGLWQVNRSRARGADFQEWIKYDIEYVDTRTWWLDLKIILKTILCLLRGERERNRHLAAGLASRVQRRGRGIHLPDTRGKPRR